MQRKCPSITSKGEPCRGYVHPGKEYCPAHDPSRADARRRAASLAGRSRSGGEIHEVKAKLRKLADDVLAKKVDKGTGSVVSQILGVLLKAIEVELRERETTVKEREFTEIKLPEFSQLQAEVAELREFLDQQSSNERSGNSWAR